MNQADREWYARLGINIDQPATDRPRYVYCIEPAADDSVTVIDTTDSEEGTA